MNSSRCSNHVTSLSPFSSYHLYLGCKEKERSEEQKRKKSEEYLLVNFPADVRKNLRGIVLPEDQEKGTRGEAKGGGGGGLRKGVGQGKTSQGTLDYHCTATQRELTQTHEPHIPLCNPPCIAHDPPHR